jgi:hypothetical protein
MLLMRQEMMARDKPAHRMAEEKKRQAGVSRSHKSQKSVQAIEEYREIRDKATIAIRSAMSPMIDGVNRIARFCQAFGQMLVTSRMFGISMCQNNGRAWCTIWKPALPEKRVARRA